MIRKLSNCAGLILAIAFSLFYVNVFSQDSIVIKTTADTYTWDRNGPGSPSNAHSTNYGTEPNVLAKLGMGIGYESSNQDYVRRAYLRFPSGSINTSKPISKALVRIRYYAKDDSANYYKYNGTAIEAVNDDTWTETGISWDNQPTSLDSISRTLDDGLTPFSSSASTMPTSDADINAKTYYFYLDITDYVNNLIANSSLPANFNFALRGIADLDAAIADGASFSSSQAGHTGRYFFSKEFTNASAQTVDSLAPSLVIYYGVASTIVSNETYYVSPTGNDNNDGLSPATAWKSLAKVSNATFLEGDSILFKAGGVWTGQLAPKGSGVAGNPIVIDSFGTGSLPIINAPGTDWSAGFMLTDQSYWSVNHLEITNQSTVNKARLFGMRIRCTDNTVGTTHTYIQNCYIHDVNSYTTESDNTVFNKGTGGIIFTGLTNEVLIKGCHIKNVSVEGIRNSSDPELCSHFVVDSNLLENIYGDGIVFHGVKEGSAITRNIGRNLCYNTSNSNYAGMWTYLSQGTRVAYNEVSGITGGGIYDGQPFDADINTNGDIFEYNYSHDNQRGFMLFMPSTSNIIVRYNISVNDAGNGERMFNYTNTSSNSTNKIYNNVFYIDGNLTEFFEGGFTGTFSNNIIYCTGTISKFSENTINSTSKFYNNCFYPQAITTTNGPAGTISGNIFDNPMFANAGYHADGITQALIDAYTLSSASPAINTGKNIPNNGEQDFAGTNIVNATYSSMGAVWPTPSSFTVVTTDTTSVTTTGDAYTYDSKSSTNYGSSAHLESKFGGGYAPEGTATANNYSRRTYLMFSSLPVDTASNISKVYVRMRYYGRNGNFSTNGTKISLSRNATWNENTITWANQNTEGGALDSLGFTMNDQKLISSAPNPITDAFINSSSYYMYLDVTDTILAMKTNGTLPQNLSFVLQGLATTTGSSIGNTGYTYFSKEFTNDGGQSVDSLMPSLVILQSTSTTTSTTPVKSSPLSAVKQQNSVQLSWTTYTELNAKHFIIERSVDGISFTPIGEVDAQNQPSNYSFVDNSPNNGINYYRFKQIDIDNTIGTISNVENVIYTNHSNQNIVVFPNPVKSGTAIKIKLNQGNFTQNDRIRLVDFQGRILKTVSGNNTQTIQLSTQSLAKGIYILSIQQASKTTNTKVVVE